LSKLSNHPGHSDNSKLNLAIANGEPPFKPTPLRLAAELENWNPKPGGQLMSKKNSKERPESKKALANKQNAAHSTGPKTPEGKKRVSRNAVKHGLLSKELLVKRGDGKENPREYKQLLEKHHRDLRPVGVLEETEVEIIANTYWQQRRVQRYETAALRARLDTAQLDYEMLLMKRFDYAVRMLIDFGSMDQIIKSSRGIRSLIATLEAVVTELSETEFVTTETYRKLQLYYGKSKPSFAAMFADFVTIDAEVEDLDGQEEGDGDCDTTLDEPRLDVLETIDCEVSWLQETLDYVLAMEELERDRRMASLSLPPEKEAERLLRYGAANERRRYKAIAQLMALQRLRKET
jgi:hypothetical protein